MPSLSFVSSAYRTEAYVADTIRSVLAQTRSDWELVVVDNGMSDALAAVVEPFLVDPRIRLLRQENLGVNGGVEAGFAASTGDYVAVLHSDDQIQPEFCERLCAVLDARPEIDALGCDALLFTDLTGAIERTSFRQRSWNPPRTLEQLHRVPLIDLLAGRQPYYTAAIRRAAWTRAGGYRLGVDRVQDLSLWLRLVAAGCSVWYLPEVLGRYRIVAESTSRGQGLRESVDNTVTMLSAAAAADGNPTAVAAAAESTRRLHRLVAVQEMRAAVVAGDVALARRRARTAFDLRRDLRSGLVLAVLWAPPPIALRVRRVTRRLRRA